MNILQKIDHEKAESERRKTIKREVESFCERFELAVSERERSLQYIADMFDDRLNIVETVGYDGADFGSETDVRAAVLIYLDQFLEEMDEVISELARLSGQAKAEREKVSA
jgi:hypothetical protein